MLYLQVITKKNGKDMQSFNANAAKYFRISAIDSDLIGSLYTEQELYQKAFVDIPLQKPAHGFFFEQNAFLNSLQKKGLLKDEKDKDRPSKPIALAIKPLVYELSHNHGKSKDAVLPHFILPLFIKAVYDPVHRVLLPEGRVLNISRDVLEPLGDGNFALGELTQWDKFLDNNKLPALEPDFVDALKQSIKLCETEGGSPSSADREKLDQLLGKLDNYWDLVLQFAKKAKKDVLTKSLIQDSYVEKDSRCYIFLENNAAGAKSNIINLYDKIIFDNDSQELPLFSNFSKTSVNPTEPLIPTYTRFASRLGHASNEYPLARAQKDVLNHLAVSQEGDIIAVNGPPGTGKTTVLLSVVASLWVEAAFKESDPPIIFAASTNNQAVTNVIDAFSKDFSCAEGVLGERWVESITSFGGYYPSGTQEKNSDLANYQLFDFYASMIEVDIFKASKQRFIKCGMEYFGSDANTVSLIKQRLHNLIKHNVKLMELIEQKLKDYYVAQESYLEAMPKIGEALNTNRHIQEALGNKIQTLQEQTGKVQSTLKAFRSEVVKIPIIYNLLGFLPSIKSKLAVIVEEALIKALDASGLDDSDLGLSGQTKADDIMVVLKNQIESNESAKKTHGLHSSKINEEIEALKLKQASIKQGFQKAIKNLASHVREVDLVTRNVQQKAVDKVVDQIHGGQGVEPKVIDDLLDITLRFFNFTLTTHYWEARWIEWVENALLDRNKDKLLDIGNKKSSNKAYGKPVEMSTMYARMMLTPCIVSTFFMLPKLMRYSYKQGNDFSKGYLYNSIDLLVVDEAGQVTPEIGAASFALAKKAMVVGDTLQIEPIWGIDTNTDMGNLLETRLLPLKGSSNPIDEQMELIEDLGLNASSGSVMKVAQKVSRYHQIPDLPRGLFLSEHRRCYDQIVGYCNDLCYKGYLEPLRGASSATDYPPMGYMHISGVCTTSSVGSSKTNKVEAEAIVLWIEQEKDNLLAKYPDKKSIDEIVGVVTPFAAQKHIIKQKLPKYAKDITVGTVHALQGAERPVVIFSTVYTAQNDGGFIDSSPSMMNVAVSRAKDHFLVFGDMELLAGKSSQSTPRGLLARYLFKDHDNQINSEVIDNLLCTKLAETITGQPASDLQQLCDYPEHDQFVCEQLSLAQKHVIIISPWLVPKNIVKAGIDQAIKDAVSRSVSVFVVADPAKIAIYEQDRKKKGETVKCVEEIEALGVQVILKENLHSKLFMRDKDIYCIGSYNWLSAPRNPEHANKEISTVISGSKAKGQIDLALQNLKQAGTKNACKSLQQA